MDSAKVTNSPGMDELRRARTGDPQGGTPAYEGDGAVKRRGVDARIDRNLQLWIDNLDRTVWSPDWRALPLRKKARRARPAKRA
jgi:hypothetical protein